MLAMTSPSSSTFQFTRPTEPCCCLWTQRRPTVGTAALPRVRVELPVVPREAGCRMYAAHLLGVLIDSHTALSAFKRRSASGSPACRSGWLARTAARKARRTSSHVALSSNPRRASNARSSGARRIWPKKIAWRTAGQDGKPRVHKQTADIGTVRLTPTWRWVCNPTHARPHRLRGKGDVTVRLRRRCSWRGPPTRLLAVLLGCMDSRCTDTGRLSGAAARMEKRAGVIGRVAGVVHRLERSVGL